MRDTCSGTTVGMHAGCTINVRLTPTTAGTRRATLVIADNLASWSPMVGSGTGQEGLG